MQCINKLYLLKFVEDIKNALDQKHTVGALFMDLSKAFDCLPHGLLIAKLHAYGLTPAACRLLGDYLSGRRQRVKISNARSPWETLAKGIPQGSILGPLIFNIFINDMFYFIEKCSLYNYADDNSLSISAPTADEVYWISNMIVKYHYAGISKMVWRQIQINSNFSYLLLIQLRIWNLNLKLMKILPLPRNLLWNFWVYTLIVALLLLTMSARAAIKPPDN